MTALASEGRMVAPLWRGVDRLVITCSSDATPTAERLCKAALVDARRDSPWPVSDGAASPVRVRGDAVVRLQVAEGALLVSVERGVVVDESEGVLAARPVLLAADDDRTIAAAVARAFDTALPWRRGPSNSRRSRRA